MFLRFCNLLSAALIIAAFSFVSQSAYGQSAFQTGSGTVVYNGSQFLNDDIRIIGTSSPGGIRIMRSQGSDFVFNQCTGLILNLGGGHNRVQLMYVTIHGHVELISGGGRDRLFNTARVRILGSLFCDMGAGDDDVFLTDNGGITIGGDCELDMGSGHNFTSLADVDLSGDFTRTGGDGPDLVVVSANAPLSAASNFFGGDVTIDLGDDRAVTHFCHSTVEGEFSYEGEDDFDFVTIEDSVLKRSCLVETGPGSDDLEFVEAEIDGTTTIRMQRDKDELRFTRSSFRSQVFCYGGQHDDRIVVDDSSFPTSKWTGLYVDGGSGFDTVQRYGAFSGRRLFVRVESVAGF